jgi:hypothetical protein
MLFLVMALTSSAKMEGKWIPPPANALAGDHTKVPPARSRIASRILIFHAINISKIMGKACANLQMCPQNALTGVAFAKQRASPPHPPELWRKKEAAGKEQKRIFFCFLTWFLFVSLFCVFDQCKYFWKYS